MKLGVVIDGSDQFIREILKDWKSRYEIEIFTYDELKLKYFEGRINHRRLNFALQKLLNKNDVVFFEWGGSLLIEASRLTTSTKIITRIQGWELWEFAPRVQWNSINQVIFLNAPMKNHFCDYFPEAADKAIVVPNIVRMDVFQPDYNNHGGVIGMLGRIIPIKRVYEAVLAIYELRSRGFNFSLRLGGIPNELGADNIRYYISLKHLVDKLNLQECVQFDGYVEHPEQFLKQIDIFLSHSFFESQHVALSEAMASGCFCLGHAWDGIEDILPAENIYFSNDELIRKVIEYWNQPEGDQLRRRTQLRDISAHKYDYNTICQKLQEIIEGIQ